MALTRKTILSAIAEEKSGFRFGTPLRVSEQGLAVVVPLLRRTAIHRMYVTLPEVGDEVAVKDSGSISNVVIENGTENNVFVRGGTMLRGSTQERATIRSAVIFAQEKRDLEVRCVHASKGIVTNASFPVPDVAYTPLVYDQNVIRCSGGMSAVSQSNAWASAELTSSVYGGVAHDVGIANVDSELYIEHDDLAGAVAGFAKEFEDILRKVKPLKTQDGIAFITDKGCETIECFDVPASWNAIHKGAIERLGPDLVKQDKNDVFDYKPEKIRSMVVDVLGQPYEEEAIYLHRQADGEPRVEITALSSDTHVGEVVEIDRRAIHLLLTRKIS